jgi:putative spermidine/putrescine transport system substrate-binding protein
MSTKANWEEEMKKMSIMGLVLCGLALQTGSAGAEDSVTVVSWGGQVTTALTNAIYKPFTEQTGIKVNSEDYDGGLAKLRAMSESNNVTWDVMDMESQDAELACQEGLVIPINPDTDVAPSADGTALKDDFGEVGLKKCGVGFDVWSYILAYDSSKFSGDMPKSPADFFDVEKFPGKRGLSKRPNATLEWALMADGVPIDQVYEVLSTPEGIDRAFKKLDTIRDNVVFWDAGAQPPQMLAAGTVTMTTAYNGRIFSAVQETKKPLEIIWDGQIMNLDYLVVTKGSKNPEAAMKFLKFASGSEPTAKISEGIPYGPVRKSAIAFVNPSVLPHLPTAPENSKNALVVDTDWWSDHADEMNERYAAWMAQ